MNIINEDAWGDKTHAEVFDYMTNLPKYILRKHYESFSEIKYLHKCINRVKKNEFYEVGCATGELYRYIKNYIPLISYRGFDISEVALKKATEKYGKNKFYKINNVNNIFDNFKRAKIVFSRDVVLHNLEPYRFIDSLLNCTEKYLIMRLRTRDTGESVLDPNFSCQRHYGKYWVPYFVLNIDELIEFLTKNKIVETINISKKYDVLGGFNGRYLPKDLYYIEAGGAETSIMIKINRESHQNKPIVSIEERNDGPKYGIFDRFIIKICRKLYSQNIPTAHPQKI